MSFWSKLTVSINNLDIFESVCRKHGVTLTRVSETYQGRKVIAKLSTQSGNTGAYIVEEDRVRSLLWDNDINYNAMSREFGKNGGILMRDYTKGVIERKLMTFGGRKLSEKTLDDGSVIMEVAVNG